MSEIVLKDAKVFFEGYDIGGDMNNITVTVSADILDTTVFGSSFRKKISGLRSAEISGTGFWDTTGKNTGSTMGKPDPILWGKIGSTVVVSIIPEGSAPGNTAYFGKMAAGEYAPSGAIGEVLGFTLAAQGAAEEFVRGKAVHIGNLTTNVSPTTAIDIGTKSTAKILWGALHLFSVASTGDAVNLNIVGSSESNFGSGTTYLSWAINDGQVGDGFTASTRVKSTKHRYYRVDMSTGGYTGAVCVGIQ